MTDLPTETWGSIFEDTLNQYAISLPTLMSVNHVWRGIVSSTVTATLEPLDF